MPLAGGYGRASISENISELMHSKSRHLSRNKKKRQSQAIAIALSKARREALRRGKHPRALFGTPSARRYLKRRRAARHARRR